jgi:hypothetical protein
MTTLFCNHFDVSKKYGKVINYSPMCQPGKSKAKLSIQGIFVHLESKWTDRASASHDFWTLLQLVTNF